MENEAVIKIGKHLKSKLTELRQKGSGHRWRCPPELRSQAVEYAHKRRQAAATISEIASELGVGESTLGKWLYRKADKGGFRSVAIVPRAADIPGPDNDDRFNLVSPNGYEVSGLDVQNLAYLLRVVG